jgi:hypothetical protein
MHVPPYQKRGYVFQRYPNKREQENMARNSLETFIEQVRRAWGPLTSEVIANCQAHIGGLLRAPATEEWLAEVQRDLLASKELYRDPEHGFVLLAHAETEGLYRSPHDHGRGWVIYAVQQGDMEVGTYARVQDPDGGLRLVRREAYRVRPGEAKVYLPGDIHDTRCTADTVLYYRFTERDLKKEREEHHLTQYVERNGIWTAGTA